MRIRIGAIGPRDSLNQIREVAKSIPQIELIEFEYFHRDDLAPIIQKNRYDVTQWIFSGPVPYYDSLENGWITSEEAEYIPFHGMGLLGTLLKISLEHGQVITGFSVDIVSEKIVRRVLKEYNLSSIRLELLPFQASVNYEEIIEFHVKKYDAKKTEVAVTCLVTVYEALKAKGIPCYRIIPSQIAIQTVLNLLVSKATSQINKKSKVVIIGFELLDDDKLVFNNTYGANRNRLAVELGMITIAERLSGTLVNKNDGQFYIYTTYGDFELLNFDRPFSQIVKEVELQTSVNLKVGIGSGHTVYDAMQNVEVAFENQGNSSARTLLFVDRNKKIIDLSRESTNYFTVERLPDSWKRILKKHNYTPTIPAKIYHFIRLKRMDEFNSSLITNLLKNTDRNTRRILNELEQMGLIEICGEESSGKPGRPKKVYTLSMLDE